MKRVLLASVGLAAVVLAAACGGGGGGSPRRNDWRNPPPGEGGLPPLPPADGTDAGPRAPGPGPSIQPSSSDTHI